VESKALPLALGTPLGLAAQVEFESRIGKQIILFEVQALSSRRFQHAFHRFNLHRLTLVLETQNALHFTARLSQ
jgi:hypothetical protein